MRPAVWAVLLRALLSQGRPGALALRAHGGPHEVKAKAANFTSGRRCAPYEDWRDGVGVEADGLRLWKDPVREGKVKTAMASAGRKLAQWAPTALLGEHVVFVGDSVTKYQYLNLAYNVMAGAPPPFEFWERSHNMNVSDYYTSMKNWFNWSNSQLQSRYGKETCDCYRYTCCSTCIENRFFSKKLLFGVSAHLTYLQWTNFTIKGHWSPSDGYPIRTHCQPGACAPPWSFELPSVGQLLRDVVVKLLPRPTHVVVNKGAWGAMSAPELEDLFREGRALSERHGMKFVWKTTLRNFGPIEPQQQQADMEMRLARQHGWHVLDAFLAGRGGLHSYMHDNVHAKEAASAYVNWMLLKMLNPWSGHIGETSLAP